MIILMMYENNLIEMKKIIIILSLFLSVLSVFADEKMTVRNADTGESFEVSFPDGLKIYEYNSNWLDSVPYLVARARYGEPWAYEALGDCYRYGKEGVEQSIFKALVYYSMSGKDIDGIAIQLTAENPLDHLALVYKLVDKMESFDKEGILCILDTLNQEGYHHADVLRNFIGNASSESMSSLLQRNIMSPETGTDETLFTMFGCVVHNCSPAILQENDLVLIAISTKFPYMYDRLAVKFLKADHEDMDSIQYTEKRDKAIEFLSKADKEAFLSREGAKILYDYYDSEFNAGRMALDVSYMERLATLAKLPESDKFIFTDN